jgi:hypothetical protein
MDELVSSGMLLEENKVRNRVEVASKSIRSEGTGEDENMEMMDPKYPTDRLEIQIAVPKTLDGFSCSLSLAGLELSEAVIRFMGRVSSLRHKASGNSLPFSGLL